MHGLSQRELIAIGAGIVVVAFVFFGSKFFFSSSEGTAAADIVRIADSAGQPSVAIAALAGAVTARGQAAKLIIEDVVPGADGREVEQGDLVTLHYVGAVQKGAVFADSKSAGEPVTFKVGVGEVVEGFDRGIVGMRAGGQRVIIVPPSLAYGRRAVASIPRNSTLVFVVELLEIR